MKRLLTALTILSLLFIFPRWVGVDDKICEERREPVNMEYRNFKDVPHDELKEAVQSLHQLLCKRGNPHTTIIVTQAFVKVVQDEIGVPLSVPD